eukprot:COSAG02_NODE_8118_length_2701_cov_4.425442_2_plen_119_part_00
MQHFHGTWCGFRSPETRPFKIEKDAEGKDTHYKKILFCLRINSQCLTMSSAAVIDDIRMPKKSKAKRSWGGPTAVEWGPADFVRVQTVPEISVIWKDLNRVREQITIFFPDELNSDWS